MHYYSGAWKVRFQTMQDRGVIFHEGIPDHNALVQWFPQGQGVFVLDNLMDEGSNDKRVLDLFTNTSIIKTSRSGHVMPKDFPAVPITSWL